MDIHKGFWGEFEKCSERDRWKWRGTYILIAVSSHGGEMDWIIRLRSERRKHSKPTSSEGERDPRLRRKGKEESKPT